ncbi:MAG: ROK family protein [Lachnospiraceae bacterium]|nr:ROK family protein [Lachnospiraceae bacterium]
MAFTNLVKKINEKSIIACMRDGKAHTKQELARLTGLSFPTVGKIVEEFAGREMFVRLGTDTESPGGRKAEVYQLNPDFAHILLLFLQGETVYYQICDALGAVKEEGRKTGRPGQLPFSLLQESIAAAMAADGKISAVAAGIPGSVHNGTVCCIDGYRELEGRNIGAELSEAAKVPVRVSNNMSLVAMGMAAQLGKKEESGNPGAGKRGSSETLVCIHLADTGPGMGAVVDGKPLQGFSGFQGEVGFMPLYGNRTVQEIALEGFRQISPGECLGKMAACICTVLNPEQVICYLEQEYAKAAQELMQYCERYLPEYAHPRFVFDRDYRADYLHGLKGMGLELLYGYTEEDWS